VLPPSPERGPSRSSSRRPEGRFTGVVTTTGRPSGRPVVGPTDHVDGDPGRRLRRPGSSRVTAPDPSSQACRRGDRNRARYASAVPHLPIPVESPGVPPGPGRTRPADRPVTPGSVSVKVQLRPGNPEVISVCHQGLSIDFGSGSWEKVTDRHARKFASNVDSTGTRPTNRST